MAYGNGRKDTLKRMVTLGVGCLTDAKLSGLSILRERYIDAANIFAEAIFSAEPLTECPNGKAMDAALLPIQKAFSGLNKAYVEKARLAVRDHVDAAHKRYLSRLVGRVRHCATEVGGDSGRRYYYVPEAIQDEVDPAELIALQTACKSWPAAIDLLRSVLIDGDRQGLSDHQVAVLKHIHEQVRSNYRRPVYGSDDEFVCQIHLDYRLVRGLREGAVKEPLNEGAARLLVDEGNARYCHFLEVSHPISREPAIRIPLTLSRKQVRRLGIDGKSVSFSAFVLEVGARRVAVKGVLEQEKPADLAAMIAANDTPGKIDNTLCQEIADRLNRCTHLMGRDFGYANTVSLAVVKRDREISASDVAELLSLRGKGTPAAKAGMLDWFTQRSHAGDKLVDQALYSGRAFLKRIAFHAERADRLSSQISGCLKKVGRLRGILAGHLGLADGEPIKREIKCDDALMLRVHRRFFALLDETNHLRRRRRDIFRKVAGLKTSWFGFLSNIEMRLAKKHNAAVIREDLTVVAPEKDSPDYKGRTFNKMINGGAKGQYIRRAADKLQWNGVPELALPSPYTSQACTRHAQLGQRRGEVFRCSQCEADRHADVHASTNIARLLLLQPSHV